MSDKERLMRGGLVALVVAGGCAVGVSSQGQDAPSEGLAFDGGSSASVGAGEAGSGGAGAGEGLGGRRWGDNGGAGGRTTEGGDAAAGRLGEADGGNAGMPEGGASGAGGYAGAGGELRPPERDGGPGTGSGVGDGGTGATGDRMGGAGGGSGGTRPAGPTAGKDWTARFSGVAEYTGPLQLLKGIKISVELRIDEYAIDQQADGVVPVLGRIAVGHCLLSTAAAGTVFLGDELTPLAFPRLSLAAAGDSDAGKLVVARLAVQGDPSGVLQGTLSLDSMESRAPCRTA